MLALAEAVLDVGRSPTILAKSVKSTGVSNGSVLAKEKDALLLSLWLAAVECSDMKPSWADLLLRLHRAVALDDDSLVILLRVVVVILAASGGTA